MAAPPDPFYVLSADPGADTGLVLIEVPRQDPAVLLRSATCTEDELIATLSRMAGDVRLHRVVCERFVKHEGIHGVDYSSLSTSALINYWADERGTRVIKPMPGEKDSFPTRQVLVNLGWWRTGKDHRHEMDAARHILVYLERLPHLPTLAKAWPR